MTYYLNPASAGFFIVSDAKYIIMNNKDLSRELLAKLKMRYSSVEMFDADMKETSDDENARHVKFVYVTESGKELGNVTVNLVKHAVGKEKGASNRMIDTVEILFDKKITERLDDTNAQGWYDFLVDLRLYAKHKLLRFDARDITRNNADTVVEEDYTATVKRLLGRY